MLDLSLASADSRLAAIDAGGRPRPRRLRARRRSGSGRRRDVRRRRRRGPQSAATRRPPADFVSHLFEPLGEGAVGLLDLPQVVGAGDHVLVGGGAEEQGGGTRCAALVDRHQACGEGAAGAAQPRLLGRQLTAGLRRACGSARRRVPGLRPAGAESRCSWASAFAASPSASAAVRGWRAGRRRSCWLHRGGASLASKAPASAASAAGRQNRTAAPEREQHRRGAARLQDPVWREPAPRHGRG